MTLQFSTPRLPLWGRWPWPEGVFLSHLKRGPLGFLFQQAPRPKGACTTCPAGVTKKGDSLAACPERGPLGFLFQRAPRPKGACANRPAGATKKGDSLAACPERGPLGFLFQRAPRPKGACANRPAGATKKGDSLAACPERGPLGFLFQRASRPKGACANRPAGVTQNKGLLLRRTSNACRYACCFTAPSTRIAWGAAPIRGAARQWDSDSPPLPRAAGRTGCQWPWRTPPPKR